MIVEYIRYELPAGDGPALVSAYEAAGAILQRSPNCLGYDLARCDESPETFILRIHWDSAEGHMQGFRKSPNFMPFVALVKPFIAHIREMRHYTPTPVAWARAE